MHSACLKIPISDMVDLRCLIRVNGSHLKMTSVELRVLQPRNEREQALQETVDFGETGIERN